MKSGDRTCTCGSSAKYTCPSCQAPYCSLACYKKHNTGCTEGFYKRNVLETAQAEEFSKESQVSLLNALKLHQQELEEIDFNILSLTNQEEETGKLHEILSRLSQGEDATQLIKELPVSHQEAFSTFVQKLTSTSKLQDKAESEVDLVLWQAWWRQENRNGKEPLVSEIVSDSEFKSQTRSSTAKLFDSRTEEEELEVGREMLTSLLSASPCSPFDVKLSSLTSKPSPLLIFHMLDILFAFAATSRVFNGELQMDSVETSLYAQGLSNILCSPTPSKTKKGPNRSFPSSNYQTARIVLEELIAKAIKPPYSFPSSFYHLLLEDVSHLLRDKETTLLSLLLFYNTFKAASAVSSNTITTQKTLDFGAKKLFFFLIWAREELKDEKAQKLKEEVLDFEKTLSFLRTQAEQLKKEREKCSQETGRGILIEEI
eukprot:TRINITY_DN5993_c0_g1_i2.p1 TRINITY_DN5993_c0_g1~~TRINITY_DN5993_c0_g1_i2.p1  ORF type:complete len:443 (-),score=98.16 TRINITY_DN5993_c0_g1_i2:23-1309(-)